MAWIAQKMDSEQFSVDYILSALVGTYPYSHVSCLTPDFDWFLIQPELCVNSHDFMAAAYPRC